MRVSIARALVSQPQVLLMDEPFAALDDLTRQRLNVDLLKWWQACSMATLFVTHNVREAVSLGDRVVLFSPHPGRICEEFKINLPRPRDINSVDVAGYATRITKALKGMLQAEGATP